MTASGSFARLQLTRRAGWRRAYDHLWTPWRRLSGITSVPRIDLTARTTRAIPAGTRFELGWRHAIDGVNAEMTPARALGSQAPVPHYLLPDTATRSEIPAGTLITGAMVEAPAGSTLWRLRAEQDAHFGL